MKKIVPVLFLKDKKAYSDKACLNLIDEKLTPVQICLRLEAAGADELFIMDLSYDDTSHDGAISVIREIGRAVSYTHLTLPTKRIVYVSGVAASLKKKQKEK